MASRTIRRQDRRQEPDALTRPSGSQRGEPSNRFPYRNSLLRSQLRYKAAWAGREYVEVDPKHTSQDCSRCGARNDPGRSETYRCRACGLVADRDVNAATNILAAGVIAAGASTWVVRPCVAPEPYARVA